MAIRLSTLAEIKVLSLTTYLRDGGADPMTADAATMRTVLDSFRQQLANGDAGTMQADKDQDNRFGRSLFKTVGIARNVRIDEDYGTQNIYGIGAPTRPRIVPNNYSVTITAERLQLDRRDLSHFMTTPEYWYSDTVQRGVGIDDVLLYTYFFVRSKEDTGEIRQDIFALMPRNSSRAFSNGDVMVAENVNLTGFKYSYEQAFFDTENLVNDSITRDL